MADLPWFASRPTATRRALLLFFLVLPLLGVSAAFAAGTGTPEGRDVRVVPGVPFGLEIFDLVGHGGGEVFGFADVAGEVVELSGADGLVVRAGERVGVGVVADELVVAVANGHLLAESPIERVVRLGDVGSGEEWSEINAF